MLTDGPAQVLVFGLPRVAPEEDSVRSGLDFLFVFLRQFAGGPGPVENNLVRFGLAAILWAALFAVAYSRQRAQALPREQLLVWGFGAGVARELFMFIQVAARVIGGGEHGAEHVYHQPLEHALSMAAVVLVAGAFLRYILDDARLSRRYFQIGLSAMAVFLAVALWQWPRHLAVFPEAQFHETWGAWLFHAPLSAWIVVAIVLLGRKRGWLRNVVVVALLFFFLGEFLFLLNYITGRTYSPILCPIGNTFHIVAIPLLGYVYLREQAIEKRRAEDALADYRDQLEDLVEERTVELTAVNTRLAAQNAVAATLSQSLDLDTVLDTALDMVLAVLDMQAGSVLLWDADGESLGLQVHRGPIRVDDLDHEDCAWHRISAQAMAQKQAVVYPANDPRGEGDAACVVEVGLQTLVSTPLAAKGRAVGALTLGARRGNAIQQPALDMLTAIGQQVGMAVENVRLYREAEGRAEELALLHQVSIFMTSTLDAAEIHRQIAEQSAKLMGCQIACVLLWDEEQGQLEVASCHGATPSEVQILRTQAGASGLLDDLVASRESIAIGDARGDPRVPPAWREDLAVRALLCLPIWGTEKPLGYLTLFDRRATRRWQPQELALIESFVNRAAIALVNAHLHKQLEWAAALEERQRIAADMHDGLAQTLGLLGLRVDRARGLIGAGSGEEATDELQRIRETVGQASAQVRRSIASLQEAPQPLRSLRDLLSDLRDQFSAEDGAPVALIVRASEPLFLPLDRRAQVLHVVQEAVSNARRHARASRIALVLERQGSDIRVRVEDDGCGFDPQDSPRDGKGHFGLSIMRARAARIGGQLQLDSRPGGGTRVCLSWTLNVGQGGSQPGVVPQAAALQAAPGGRP